jgi:hypothetical protein
LLAGSTVGTRDQLGRFNPGGRDASGVETDPIYLGCDLFRDRRAFFRGCQADRGLAGAATFFSSIQLRPYAALALFAVPHEILSA